MANLEQMVAPLTPLERLSGCIGVLETAERTERDNPTYPWFEMSAVMNALKILRDQAQQDATKVVLNGQERLIGGRSISYEQIVTLAGVGAAASVVVRHRHGPAIILLPGKSVPVGDDMIIDAVNTGNA